MADLRRVEAKPYHCGRMSRILRFEQQAASARIGIDVHRALREIYGHSYFLRAWAVNGDVAALAGIAGPLLSPIGFLWLALSERMTRYPKYIVTEARAMLDEVMRDKIEIRTALLGGDEAAMRLAVFLGFQSSETDPAFSRYGRRMVLRHLHNNSDIRMPIGGGFSIPMTYQGHA